MDADFAEVGERKRPPRPSMARWDILLALLLPFTALTDPAVSPGSTGNVRDRPVALTTLATITGPVLALGLIAQVVPPPFRRGRRPVRLVLWTLGWLVWLFSGQVSFLHALG